MGQTTAGADLRQTIFAAVKSLSGIPSTRSIAAKAGTSHADAFRELAKLEEAGVVVRRPGANVASVSWLLLPKPAAAMVPA